MTRARGNPNSQAEIELRREQVIEKLKTADHQTLSQLAEDLGVSRATLWRDLQAIEARFVAGTADDIRQFKEAQYHALLKIEEATVKGAIEPEVANALTRIRESVAKLLGLNAPTKSVSLSATVESSPLFLKFKAAVDGLTDVQVENVLAYAAGLARTPVVAVKDASWFPEPKLKLLGGTTDAQATAAEPEPEESR